MMPWLAMLLNLALSRNLAFCAACKKGTGVLGSDEDVADAGAT